MLMNNLIRNLYGLVATIFVLFAAGCGGSDTGQPPPVPNKVYSLNDNYELALYKGKDVGLPPIESAAATAHKSQVFVTGGYLPSGKRSSDYYISNDSYGFSGPYPMGIPARNGHCTLSVFDKLYLIGGAGSDGYFSDIYVFDQDLTTFIFHSKPPWSQRAFFGCEKFHDGVIIFGGNSSLGALSDVWFSKNMVEWELISNNFPARGMFGYFIDLQNKITVVGGGIYNASFKNNIEIDFEEILISDDGIYWYSLNEKIYPKRRFPGFGKIGSTMITIGGYSDDNLARMGLNLKSILHSEDGYTFEPFAEIADFRPRHAPIVYWTDKELFILNGNDGVVFSDFYVIRKKSP
jgi:hypothetical protein